MSRYIIVKINKFSKWGNALKVKVKDIAKAAGVSTTAVSLVLNDKPCRLSDSTKEHILRVARELKFQKEHTINPEALGKVKTVGLVVPDSGNQFFRQLAGEVSQCLFAQGYTVLQCFIEESLDRCYQALESLACKNVDGIIVVVPGSQSKDPKLIKMLKSLQDSGIPMILADRAVYSVFCDFVTADNKHGGRVATEYLFHAGHKKIGCILGKPEVYTVRKRLEGYKQALALLNIPYEKELVFFGLFDAETGKKGTGALLEQGVTGIFAGNDEIAYGIYQYAKEHGIRIPEELSVIGFDNSELCDLLVPPLTSVEQNVTQMGERVAEVMLHNIQGTEMEETPRNYYFTPFIVERESVGER